MRQTPNLPFNLKPEQKDYVDTGGAVRYLDGGRIDKPIDMPPAQRIAMLAFIAVGVVVGIFLIMHAKDALFGNAERDAEETSANLSREVAYDMPTLTSFVWADDDSIRQSFTDSGFSMYEYSEASDFPTGGFQTAHLPSDLAYEEGVALFDKGFSSLDCVDASLLMNGLWMFEADRTDGVGLRVRYVDFTSGSVEAAIDAAMAQQGFSADSLLAEDGSGVDDVGNTFKAGTVDVDGTSCQWRVSAVPLADVYEISGLPDTAVFVGVRLTA